jgi:pimeloyl-ACP methyl ester carboxylesterase
MNQSRSLAVPSALRIKTSGATLAARLYEGNGSPIVLLHGGPGWGDYFGAFPEMLSPPYRVLRHLTRIILPVYRGVY